MTNYSASRAHERSNINVMLLAAAALFAVKAETCENHLQGQKRKQVTRYYKQRRYHQANVKRQFAALFVLTCKEGTTLLLTVTSHSADDNDLVRKKKGSVQRKNHSEEEILSHLLSETGSNGLELIYLLTSVEIKDQQETKKHNITPPSKRGNRSRNETCLVVQRRTKKRYTQSRIRLKKNRTRNE